MFNIDTKLNQWFESKDERLEEMTTEITQGISQLLDSEKWLQFLNATAGFTSYSFRNQMLIVIQKPDAQRVASKSFWFANGRKLKPFDDRGPGISILGGSRRRSLVKDANGEPILDSGGKRQYEIFMVYGTATVYDVSQTVPINEDDELALALANRSDLSDDPETVRLFTEHMEALLVSAGYTVERHPVPANGLTIPSSSKVIINSSLNPLDSAMTLAHEAGHVYADHVLDLEDYQKHRGVREVVAEGVSYALASAAGLRATPDTNFYMAQWVTNYSDTTGKSVEDALMEAGTEISNTVRTMLG